MTNTRVRRLPERVAWQKLMLGFACRRGNSLKERVRLFYHAGLKPSLVCRGWASYAAERILCFSTKTAAQGCCRVHVRDNGLDMSTFVEFFSSRHVLIPPELPPLDPEVIYDIGANIGMASLFYATHYPKARFYGFEPLPANLEVCRLNYRSLAGAEAFPWAIGSRSGTAVFEFSETDSRGGRLQDQPGPKAGSLKREFQVPVFSIADLVAQKKLPPPDFLKIDVEGAELEVLKGMGEQAPHIRRLLVETHGPAVDAACREWLPAHQFAIRHSHEAAPGYAAIWCDRV